MTTFPCSGKEITSALLKNFVPYIEGTVRKHDATRLLQHHKSEIAGEIQMLLRRLYVGRGIVQIPCSHEEALAITDLLLEEKKKMLPLKIIATQGIETIDEQQVRIYSLPVLQISDETFRTIAAIFERKLLAAAAAARDCTSGD